MCFDNWVHFSEDVSMCVCVVFVWMDYFYSCYGEVPVKDVLCNFQRWMVNICLVSTFLLYYISMCVCVCTCENLFCV